MGIGMETRLDEIGGRTERLALAAERAEDKQELIDAMRAYLADLQELSEAVTRTAKTTEGGDRENVDATVGNIRRNAFRVAECLAAVRHTSGDRWRECRAPTG